MTRDLTDATVKMTPSGNYAYLTGSQLAALIARFKAAGLDKRPARPGETARMAEELGLKYPAQAWAHLGFWRKRLYDEPRPAARQTTVPFKLSTDETRQILAVAALLKRRLQQ
jgi:hypothetical protein